MRFKKIVNIYMFIYLVIFTGILFVILKDNKEVNVENKKEIVVGFKQITGIKVLKEVTDIFSEISFYKLTTPKQNYEGISVKKLVDQQLIGTIRTNDTSGLNSSEIYSQISNLISYEIKPNIKLNKVDIVMNIKDKLQYKKELSNFILEQSDIKVILLDDKLIFTK